MTCAYDGRGILHRYWVVAWKAHTPYWSAWVWALALLVATAYPSNQQMMTDTFGSWSPRNFENQKEFLGASCSLARLLRHLLFETTHGQFISPSLPHPISLFQIKIINILKFILKWNVSLDDLNGHAKAILPLAINVCLSMAAMRQLCPIDTTEIGSGTVWPH